MQQISSRYNCSPVAEALLAHRMELPMGQVTAMKSSVSTFTSSTLLTKSIKAQGKQKMSLLADLWTKYLGCSRFKLEIGEPQLTKVEHTVIHVQLAIIIKPGFIN